MEINNRKLLAIAVVAVVVIAAIGVAVISLNNQGPTRDHSKYADMSWDEILEEAKGSTVNVGQFPDAYIKKWYTDYVVPAAAELGITVNVQGSMYGNNGANQIVADHEAGTVTLDTVWGAISAYAILLNDSDKNLNFNDNWVSYLPNSKYLPSDSGDVAKSTYELVSGKDWNSTGVGSTMPFSSGITGLYYNKEFNAKSVTFEGASRDVAYNDVVVLNKSGAVVGFITVGPSDTGKTPYVANDYGANGTDTVYSINAVREYYKTGAGASSFDIRYGLPSNFVDMYEWAQIYDQQMTYVDPSSSGAWFHGYMFIQAIMYELCWENKDPTTGNWALASDYEWKVNGKTVPYSEYLNNELKTVGYESTDANNKKYMDLVGYAYAYLEDLEPFCNKSITHNVSWISGISGKIVGKNDETDYNDSTVMFSYSSVGSISMRSADFEKIDPAIYMLDTCVYDTYYFDVNIESENMAAVLALLNIYLDPEIQASWYQYCGNSYNIDVNMKYGDTDKSIWDTFFKDFVDDWSADTYISLDDMQDKTITNYMVAWNGYLTANWTEIIG